MIINGVSRRAGIVFAVIMSLTLACLMAACGGSKPSGTTVRLATTTSTKDSGLLAAILPDFEAKTGWKVEVISVGSGEAMQLGENGEVDVLLVHSPAAERAFVLGDHSDITGRLDVMYNDYVIIGPKSDPADIKTAAPANAVAAFKALVGGRPSFISRGDQSGTHNKELAIWELAGLEPLDYTERRRRVVAAQLEVGITPRFNIDWYVVAGSGMGAVITMADEKQAYTLADRATWLSYAAKTNLEIVSENDPSGILNNPYGVICVNPDKNSSIQHNGAVAFQKWITSPETQELIGKFGVAQYGMPLFTPNAK